jgi:hypothetical protein
MSEIEDEAYTELCEENERLRKLLGWKWLIWSLEHGGWWRSGRMGYTGEVKEAGRYSFLEAREICLGANRYVERVHEAMVPVEGEERE